MARNKTLLLLSFPLVFLFGAVVGWSAQAIFMRRAAAHFMARGAGGQQEALLERYARDLDLTEEQRDKLEIHLAKFEVKFAELRQDHKRELEALLKERRDLAGSFLDEGEIEKMKSSDEQAMSRAERFGPPGGRFGRPGEEGGPQQHPGSFHRGGPESGDFPGERPNGGDRPRQFGPGGPQDRGGFQNEGHRGPKDFRQNEFKQRRMYEEPK